MRGVAHAASGPPRRRHVRSCGPRPGSAPGSRQFIAQSLPIRIDQAVMPTPRGRGPKSSGSGITREHAREDSDPRRTRGVLQQPGGYEADY